MRPQGQASLRRILRRGARGRLSTDLMLRHVRRCATQPALTCHGQTMRNHNHLLGQEGLDGIKTGYTAHRMHTLPTTPWHRTSGGRFHLRRRHRPRGPQLRNSHLLGVLPTRSRRPQRPRILSSLLPSGRPLTRKLKYQKYPVMIPRRRNPRHRRSLLLNHNLRRCPSTLTCSACSRPPSNWRGTTSHHR